MKVSISEASRMAGIKSRSTFYRHIEKKGISVEKDEEGNPVVDVSELVRVYGDKVQINTDTQNTKIQDQTPQQSVPQTAQAEDTIPLTVFNKVQEQIEELYQDRIDELKKQLEAQTRQNTLLLEDQSAKNNGAGEWERAFKSLESRLANREKEDKELKEQTQKMMDENKRLKEIALKQKRALAAEKAKVEAEKNKSFFAKLFGYGRDKRITI